MFAPGLSPQMKFKAEVGGNEQVGCNEETNVAGVEAVMVVVDAGARMAEAWAG